MPRTRHRAGTAAPPSSWPPAGGGRTVAAAWGGTPRGTRPWTRPPRTGPSRPTSPLRRPDPRHRPGPGRPPARRVRRDRSPCLLHLRNGRMPVGPHMSGSPRPFHVHAEAGKLADESPPGPVDPDPGCTRRAVEDPPELTGGEALPRDEPKQVTVGRGEATERPGDPVAALATVRSGRVIGRPERSEPGEQAKAAAPTPPVVGQHPAGHSVQPQGGLPGRRGRRPAGATQRGTSRRPRRGRRRQHPPAAARTPGAARSWRRRSHGTARAHSVTA